MFSRISIYLLFFLSLNLQADELSSEDEFQLPVIIIKSNWFVDKKPDEFAQSIEVLKGDVLKRKKSNSVGEAVKNELGVSSTYFAPGASRPIIRGLGSNRVRVLENGIDSLDASSVSEDHAVSIEPYFADQIEILRGPSTLRYGPGAIGGVVNVLNRRIPDSLNIAPIEVNALVEHATVSDSNTVAIELNGLARSFAWHLDGLSRDTNDYKINGFANEGEPENRGRLSNSDVETDNIGFGGSFINDQGMIGFAFSRLDTDYGIPGAEEGDIRIDLKQYRYEGKAALNNPTKTIDSVSLKSTYSNYRHFEIEESGEIATTFDNEEIESRLEIIHSINNNWKNAFGIQYNDREFSAVGEEAFIQPVDERRYGLFVVTRVTNSLWDIETGVRFDHDEFDPENNEDEGFNVFSLSLGAQRTFADNIQFSIFAARSERAPQETALYADGPHLATLTFETGSVDIDKETSYSVELGLKQQQETYSWRINTFYNLIDDFIYLAFVDNNNDGIADRADEEGAFELNGELLVGQYANEEATFYGIEAEFKKQLIANESYTLDGRLFGDYVRANFRDNDIGNVPRITPPRFGIGMEGTKGTWSGNIDLIFIADQNKEAELETDTNGYTMLNATISKKLFVGNTDFNLFIKGDNLLDEDARQHTSFQKDRIVLPGRGLTLGASLVF